uniref:Uncharacterized protein n=1 Tax=Manihot esculenta TaxID=3983 RepID=A0A2C9WI43_MANES
MPRDIVTISFQVQLPSISLMILSSLIVSVLGMNKQTCHNLTTLGMNDAYHVIQA